MGKAGRPRRDALIRLASRGPQPRIDVGADHGRVAAAIDGIATELQSRAPPAVGVPWVVADGLDCFSRVGTAVIAGMGARSIARILDRAPPVELAVLHAQDDPPALRIWLAANGWAIVEEAVAPEARRYAEIVVARRGTERETGLTLEYGPHLTRSDDPGVRAHFEQLAGHLERLCRQSRAHPDTHRGFTRRLDYVRGVLAT